MIEVEFDFKQSKVTSPCKMVGRKTKIVKQFDFLEGATVLIALSKLNEESKVKSNIKIEIAEKSKNSVILYYSYDKIINVSDEKVRS